ncbi:MAG: hypothetical protein Q9171_004724 [Xanthocarpia ochracea]
MVSPVEPPSEDVEMAPSPPSSVASITSSAQDQSWITNTREELRSCLAQVKYVGRFTAFRTSQQNVDPGLYIDKIGSISLPLRVEDAERIVKSAKQAPFGRGSRTVVDKSFRNTKELDPNSFQLQNPAWTGFLADTIEELGAALGYQDSPAAVRADLHKLLLYDQGAMFKAHRDSEKADGMFATLVICLPSKHEGGEIVLSHHGEEETVRTSEESRFGQTHVAWYSDVLHEIKPVISGYRLMLTYNLIQTHAGIPTSADTILRERQALSRVLHEWKRSFEGKQPTPAKMVYFLDHQYSSANLCLDKLKGCDRLVGRYVVDACNEEGFYTLLAHCDLHYTRTEHDDEDRDEEWRLNYIVRPTDGKEILQSAELRTEEMVQEDRYHRSAHRTEEEETGNEGVETTFFYHDSVMILMPIQHYVTFLLQHLTHSGIINWMQKLMDSVESGSSDSARDTLVRICARESSAWSQRKFEPGDPNEILIQCIKACRLLQDYDPLSNIAEVCCQYPVQQIVYKAFAECIPVFGFTKLRSRYVTMFASFRQPHQATKSSKTALGREWAKYIAWEKSVWKRLLSEPQQTLYEDSFALLQVIKWHGKDLSLKGVLPYVVGNTTLETTTLVSFLTELSSAVRDAEVPISIAEPFFNQLIKPTVSNLSLQLLKPDQSAPKEPHWWRDTWRKEHPSSIYKDKLGGRISRLYCLCRTRGLDTEAKGILTWLEREADSAHVAVFPFVLVPFMETLRPVHQETGVAISAEVQETCVSITIKLSKRCIGPEPQKPVDWRRPPITCPSNAKGCVICAKMNAFLGKPDQHEETFDSNVSALCAILFQVGEARFAMPAFDTVKDFYGDRWEEVNGMIWSRKANFK